MFETLNLTPLLLKSVEQRDPAILSVTATPKSLYSPVVVVDMVYTQRETSHIDHHQENTGFVQP